MNVSFILSAGVKRKKCDMIRILFYDSISVIFFWFALVLAINTVKVKKGLYDLINL